MPDRTVDPVYVPFTVTTQPGVQPSAPTVTNLDVGVGTLETVHLLIPDGHQGLTGIRFLLSGQQVLPWSNVAAWIIDNGLDESFDVNVEADTHLQAVTYNTGRYPHSHLLRCRVRQLPLTSGMPAVGLIPAAQLHA